MGLISCPRRVEGAGLPTPPETPRRTARTGLPSPASLPPAAGPPPEADSDSTRRARPEAQATAATRTSGRTARRARTTPPSMPPNAGTDLTPPSSDDFEGDVRPGDDLADDGAGRDPAADEAGHQGLEAVRGDGDQHASARLRVGDQRLLVV